LLNQQELAGHSLNARACSAASQLVSTFSDFVAAPRFESRYGRRAKTTSWWE
jgi:hypothetical protein